MDRDEALRLLKGGPDGVEVWNRHRLENPDEHVVLVGADLHGADLRAADLRGANLYGAVLYKANLYGADLHGAVLRAAVLSETVLIRAVLYGADLHGAVLRRADLHGAVLRGVVLTGADLRGADLSGADLMADFRPADLSEADLTGAVLRRADLTGAVLTKCRCNQTAFVDQDLSEVKGLDSVDHDGPSSLGIDTLYKSRGKIPEAFLRGCGVPDALIANLPSLLGAMEPIQFYSCFLSHSSADKDFARRLFSRMRDEGLRVWFDEVDMRSGRKLHEQIDEAIRLHDKLLLVLSPNSMGSEWVRTELCKAFKQERREGKRKLFPIALVPYGQIHDWECFDADHGKDLAVEVREYFIPDFSAWKDDDAFEAGFARLLNDLKAEAPPAGARPRPA
jgi:uncharacterized protein YjbI with pentapeptide repeats